LSIPAPALYGNSFRFSVSGFRQPPNPDKPEPKTFKDLPQRHKGHQGTPRNIFLFVNLCVLCVLVVNFLPTEHGKAGTKRFLANFLPEKARILEISY
jgi:hypothetical protein